MGKRMCKKVGTCPKRSAIDARANGCRTRWLKELDVRKGMRRSSRNVNCAAIEMRHLEERSFSAKAQHASWLGM